MSDAMSDHEMVPLMRVSEAHFMGNLFLSSPSFTRSRTFLHDMIGHVQGKTRASNLRCFNRRVKFK